MFVYTPQDVIDAVILVVFLAWLAILVLTGRVGRWLDRWK